MGHDHADQGTATEPVGRAVAEAEVPTRFEGSEARSLVVAAAVVGLIFGIGLATQALLPAAQAFVVVLAVAAGFALWSAQRLDAAMLAGLAWLSLCAAITTVVLQVGDTEQHTLSLALFAAAASGGILVAAALGTQVRAGHSWQGMLSSIGSVLSVPTTGVAALLIGAGASMPLVGSYSPLVIHPDSAWFVASTRHVRENGMELLQRTQDVWLPHLTIGPLIAIDGYRAAIAFVVVTTMLLVSLAAYIAFRLTGRGAAALSAAAALLASPGLLEQANRLPMYASAFGFAYGSAWLLHRAMAVRSSPWWWSTLAGVGFVLAYESHAIGQLFLIAPFLLIALHPWAQARRPLLISLITIVFVSIPRVVINYSDGGFTAFRSNYTDFFIQNYIDVVNEDFWGHNHRNGAVNYLTKIPGMLGEVWGHGTFILLLAIPVIFALRHSQRRSMLFAFTVAGFMTAALAIQSPAPYARYLLPILAGAAIAIGVGVGKMVERSSDARFIGGVIVLALSVAAIVQMTQFTSATADTRRSVLVEPGAQLADRIDDERAVIGVRSHQLARTDSSLVAYNWRLMFEDDWVTYLSWPSDNEVVDMLDEYDIGWVYVMPHWNLEVLYHQTWLEPAYGVDVVHDQNVAESEAFCLVAESAGYLLYREGNCEPGDLQRNPQETIDGFSSAIAATQMSSLDESHGG